MAGRLRAAASRLSLSLLVAGLLLVGVTATGRAAGPEVVVLTADGIVDGVMAGYIEDGVAAAVRTGAAAVVIRLDTPGGSLDATGRIKTALLESRVPVIVWVAPSGGRAASAGTFITLAANLAFMAPATNIGAAAPVDSTGGDIPGTLGVKVRNDAIASITAIAEARGRPVAWAVSTVADARSYPASEAIAAGAVDGMADTLAAVLAAANGRTVTVAGGPVVLALADATIQDATMNPVSGLLHLLADPDIAFVLFAVGLLGLIVEFIHPNLLSGISGALCLILAFLGFGSLPLNLAGLLLIGLGAFLFLLEAQVASHGLLTLGGAISFALGASALYTGPLDPFEPAARVASPLLAVATVTTAGIMLLVAVAAARARKTGTAAGLVGAAFDRNVPAVVRRPLAPVGSVHAAGEEWTARSADGSTIDRGASVKVVEVEGLTLVVAPDSSPRS